MGGDWNLTYSIHPGPDNIDILNMVSPPSLDRSRRLQELCEKRDLVDPYRTLYPENRDYTYTPRTGGRNRSRLDFFLVPTQLLDIINNSEIIPGILTKLFDHKMIKLSFCKPVFSKKKMVINNEILSHGNFEYTVYGTVLDTYFQHVDRNRNEGLDIENTLLQIGTFMTTCRDLNDLQAASFLTGTNPLLEMEIAGKKQDIAEQTESLPVPAALDTLHLECAPDIFFEVLLNNIKNAVFSLQQWDKKIKGRKKETLVSTLKKLKEDFLPNEERILDIEGQLNEMENLEIL